jgi:hypothetical protein
LSIKVFPFHRFAEAMMLRDSWHRWLIPGEGVFAGGLEGGVERSKDDFEGDDGGFQTMRGSDDGRDCRQPACSCQY